MFGNLSKSLVKVPNHFNINIDKEHEQKNLSKKSYEKILNSKFRIKKLNYYKLHKSPYYFKEKDYVNKNLNLDLNINNNFRKELSSHIKPRLSLSFEEFLYGKNYNNTANNTNTKMLNYNSRFNTDTNTKNSFSSKNSLNFRETNDIIENEIKLDNGEFNEKLNTNIDKLIEKIHENSLNFNIYKKRRGFGGTTRMKRIEILKDFINQDNIINSPVKLKFPKISIKSNEKIYRDTLDKKLTSLSMITPKIKEQLKNKNRYYTTQKEFYKFNNSYFSNKQNPLTETVKCLEEKEKIDEKNNKFNLKLYK